MEKVPHVSSIEVTYRDIDSAGHINSPVYYNYLQHAYLKYMHTLLDLPYDDKVPQIMVKSSCDFVSPARFGDTIVVETAVTRFGSKSFDVEYVLKRNEDNEIVAKGASTHVAYDYEKAATLPIHDDFRQRVMNFQKSL